MTTSVYKQAPMAVGSIVEFQGCVYIINTFDGTEHATCTMLHPRRDGVYNLKIKELKHATGVLTLGAI